MFYVYLRKRKHFTSMSTDQKLPCFTLIFFTTNMSVDENFTYFLFIYFKKKNASLRTCQLTKCQLISRLFIPERRVPWRTLRVSPIVFVAILLVLWYGNFDSPTTCAFIVLGGWWRWWWGAFYQKNRSFCFYPQFSSSFICKQARWYADLRYALQNYVRVSWQKFWTLSSFLIRHPVVFWISS